MSHHLHTTHVTGSPSPPPQPQPFQQLSAPNSADYNKIASLLYLEIDWSRGQSNYYYRFYPDPDQLSIIRLDPTDSLLPLSGPGKWFQTISSLANILAPLFFKSGNLENDKGNGVQQMRFRNILLNYVFCFQSDWGLWWSFWPISVIDHHQILYITSHHPQFVIKFVTILNLSPLLLLSQGVCHSKT